MLIYHVMSYVETSLQSAIIAISLQLLLDIAYMTNFFHSTLLRRYEPCEEEENDHSKWHDYLPAFSLRSC